MNILILLAVMAFIYWYIIPLVRFVYQFECLPWSPGAKVIVAKTLENLRREAENKDYHLMRSEHHILCLSLEQANIVDAARHEYAEKIAGIWSMG
jgi:hypothetical protein